MSSGENQSRSPHRRWYINSVGARIGIVFEEFNIKLTPRTNAINIITFTRKIIRNQDSTQGHMRIINEEY